MTLRTSAAAAMDDWSRHDESTAAKLAPMPGHEVIVPGSSYNAEYRIMVSDVIWPDGDSISWSGTHIDGVSAGSSSGVRNVVHTEAGNRRAALDLVARRVAFKFYSSEPAQPITDEEYLEALADAYMAVLAEIRIRQSHT